MENIQELMRKHLLDGKEFTYTIYSKQVECLRGKAIKLWGVDKVARMDTSEIEKEFAKMGLIPMQISFYNGCDCENIYLVPIQQLDKFETLER